MGLSRYDQLGFSSWATTLAFSEKPSVLILAIRMLLDRDFGYIEKTLA